jgi:hypothetical protein
MERAAVVIPSQDSAFMQWQAWLNVNMDQMFPHGEQVSSKK